MANLQTHRIDENLAGSGDLVDFYRSAFLASRRGILLIDFDLYRVRDANPAALALLACTPKQLLEQSLLDLTVFGDLPDLERVLQQLPDTGAARYEEIPLSTSGGHSTFVDITFHPYSVRNSRIIECNLEVVTSRKLRQMRERRSHTIAALAHMAEHVARELDGLLPVISASSDLALGPGALVPPSYQALEEVQKARIRLATLARGLVAFSGRQALQIQPVDLNRHVAGLEVKLCEVLGDRIQLIRQLAPEIPAAKADPGQLQFAILALAAFARRRMPEGGTFEISTQAIEANDPALCGFDTGPRRFLRLTLADNAGTLDERAWAHLFEPFHGAASGDENGLALAAVYGIVKQSGGYISVKSGDGGTVFGIYLPSAENFVPALDRRAAEPGRAVETIVLFEEEEGLLHLVRNLLTRKGYKILEAQTEDSVRRIFAGSGSSVDLLVAHVKAAGLAANMALAHPGLKLIYISGFTDDAAEDLGPVGSDAAILQKPFRLDALLTKIRSVLDNKPAAR